MQTTAYVYIYVCVCLYVDVHVCASTCMYVLVCMYVYMCMCVFVYMCVPAYSGADNRVNRSNCDTSMKLGRNIYFM